MADLREPDAPGIEITSPSLATKSVPDQPQTATDDQDIIVKPVHPDAAARKPRRRDRGHDGVMDGQQIAPSLGQPARSSKAGGFDATPAPCLDAGDAPARLAAGPAPGPSRPSRVAAAGRPAAGMDQSARSTLSKRWAPSGSIA